MSIDTHRYGSLAPIYFKVTLNGAGVPSLTFDAADIKVATCTDATPNPSFTNIGTEVSYLGEGIYYWTPTGTATQGEILVISIRDTAGGPLFDENCLIIQTGGHPTLARLDGV